jgi:hypothetical protein
MKTKLQMANSKRQILLAALLIFVHTLAHSAGNDLPLNDWIGKKFVILPKPEDQRIYGYSCLRRSEGGYIVPTYNECAGMIGTVTAVDIPPQGDVHVHLLIEKNGREYLAVAAQDHVPCLAPLADFELARKNWEGKTIWIKEHKFLLDTEGGRLKPEKNVARFSAVHVDTIIAGYSPSQPVRLVLTQGDKVVCADIRVSDINTPAISRGPKLAELLFDQDPRTLHDWSPEIWQTIEKNQIATGMSMEQVHMSWGEPNAITKIESANCNCEEWEYDKTVVHFRDGKVDEVTE